MFEVKHITKEFQGVKALNDISLELHSGEVTAIIGENGAGKSTLMKILSGVYTNYEGSLVLDGKELKFNNVRDAQAKGITIIHQELNLIPWLSVQENIFLGRELENKWGLLDQSKMRQKTSELLALLHLNINPEDLVATLKVGQQQLVEIAKALLTEARVIIMDEPTSAISDKEVELLFGIIRELKASGKTIVYISHKLDELFSIADQYVVIRDGNFIAAGKMNTINHDQLIEKMVGREIKFMRKLQQNQYKEKVLSVKNLSLNHQVIKGQQILHGVSFDLHAGEILGLFGLMGAGRTELSEVLFGLHPTRSSAHISVAGVEMTLSSVQDAIQAGIALVPEDRKQNGLIIDHDVQSNLSITVLDDLLNGPFLDVDKERKLVEQYVIDLAIKTSGAKQLVGNLSGGNQQKIVLAKWLATHPKVLLLDEPTRGIDINAKNEIYKLMFELAEKGIGVLLISSELPELLALSDRILVMSEGKITAEIEGHEATEQKILKAAIPK